MKDYKKYMISSHRKQKSLQIKDIAFLLDIDSSKLSRFENGKLLSPELKVCLGYHIIFNLPMPTLVHEQYEALKEGIENRCFQLLEKIDDEKQDYGSNTRKASINAILNKLMLKENDEA